MAQATRLRELRQLWDKVKQDFREAIRRLQANEVGVRMPDGSWAVKPSDTVLVAVDYDGDGTDRAVWIDHIAVSGYAGEELTIRIRLRADGPCEEIRDVHESDWKGSFKIEEMICVLGVVEARRTKSPKKRKSR